MKITFLISRFLDGGIDSVLVRYANALCQQHEISLVIASEYGGMQKFVSDLHSDVKVKYLVRDGILTSVLKNKYAKKATKLGKIADAIFLTPVRRLLQKTRLKEMVNGEDVIIDFDSSFYSLLPDERCKTLAFFHFSLNNYHNGKTSKINRLCNKLLGYDRIVAICNKMQEEFVEHDSRFSDKVFVVYNPVDENLLRSKAAEYAPPAEPYILSVARLQESQKDYTSLLKAYAQAGNLPKLYILGEGPDRERIESLAKELGVAEQVVFCGFVGNPMPYIANAELLVLSSKFEGLPTILIEGLTLDKVMLATDCPTGPREILADGKCGHLVPVGDVRAMAEALPKLIYDKELRAHHIRNIAHHKSNFAVETSVEKLINLCKK